MCSVKIEEGAIDEIMEGGKQKSQKRIAWVKGVGQRRAAGHHVGGGRRNRRWPAKHPRAGGSGTEKYDFLKTRPATGGMDGAGAPVCERFKGREWSDHGRCREGARAREKRKNRKGRVQGKKKSLSQKTAGEVRLVKRCGFMRKRRNPGFGKRTSGTIILFVRELFEAVPPDQKE